MQIIVSIGDLPVSFDIRSKEMLSRIKKRYQGYIRRNVQSVLTLECSFSSNFSAAGEEVTIKQFDNSSWHIYRSDFDCNIKKNIGSIGMRRSIYSFDACLRVIYSTLLTVNKGLLLHAAGIVSENNNAYLFAGPSRSGKTTVAKLSSGYGTVINDEIVACRVSDKDTIAVYGTPFWGEMRRGPAYNTCCSLHAIYFLKKRKGCTKITLSHEDALSRLLRCCCIFSRASQDMDKIMQTAITLVNSVPVYELHFEKKPSFWDVVQF